MRLQKRKGTVDGYEWRCRNQSKDNRHDVVRSVRKGTWFSESKLGITIILRLTRYWFGKSMNAFVVNDLKVNKNTVMDWYMFCREVCMIAWCIHHPKKNRKRMDLCTTALFLSAKINEKPGKLEHVIKTAHSLLHRYAQRLDDGSECCEEFHKRWRETKNAISSKF
ncbi:mitotic-spindle organizing protein 2A [Trichonephila clavipes]|nr:mitotic-spindle organizing protein 2A [Trichonephila clavipes]